MQTSTILTSTLSAWFMAIVYDFIEAATGIELRFIAYAAMAVMAIGIYRGLRDNEETTEGEV
jgi:hypothetical protein